MPRFDRTLVLILVTGLCLSLLVTADSEHELKQEIFWMFLVNLTWTSFFWLMAPMQFQNVDGVNCEDG